MKKSLFCVGALLSVGLFACKDGGKYERYDDAKKYVVGTVALQVEQIEEIEVDWFGGSVEIQPSMDGYIRAEEDAEGLNEDSRMRYYIDEGTLKIKYCQSGYKQDIQSGSKNLRLQIPQGIDFELDGTTTEVTIGVVQTGGFSIQTTTGNISAEKITCTEGELTTRAGKIYVGEIDAQELEVECGKGETKIGAGKGLHGEFSSTSGNIHLQLLSDVGARVRFCTDSGELVSQKPFVKKDGCYVFSTNSTTQQCHIDVQTKSGNFHLE